MPPLGSGSVRFTPCWRTHWAKARSASMRLTDALGVGCAAAPEPLAVATPGLSALLPQPASEAASASATAVARTAAEGLLRRTTDPLCDVASERGGRGVAERPAWKACGRNVAVRMNHRLCVQRPCALQAGEAGPHGRGERPPRLVGDGRRVRGPPVEAYRPVRQRRIRQPGQAPPGDPARGR